MRLTFRPRMKAGEEWVESTKRTWRKMRAKWRKMKQPTMDLRWRRFGYEGATIDSETADDIMVEE